MKAVIPEELPAAVLETSYQLGKLIAAKRKAMGLSQEALCIDARIGRSTLVEIEAGSPRVQFVHWLRVLNALDLLDRLSALLSPAEIGQIADAIPSPRSRR